MGKVISKNGKKITWHSCLCKFYSTFRHGREGSPIFTGSGEKYPIPTVPDPTISVYV